MSSDTGGAPRGTFRTVRLRWSDAILVCGKCLKHHDDGKTLRRALKAAAKARAATEGKGRKVRIIKVGCLGLCPRNAVALASATALSAGEVMLVRDADEIADAVPRLLPSRPTPPPGPR